MIRINGVPVEATRFPDGTTQTWKLPPELFGDGRPVAVDWRFEREDELLTVAQLRALFAGRPFTLHVPYLPFARQDKGVANDQTFALRPFATLLNSLDCDAVTAVDVHNPALAASLLRNFRNVDVRGLHAALINRLKPDLIVFPDAGASARYPHLKGLPFIVFRKTRDAASGRITGYELQPDAGRPDLIRDAARLLVVDDLCDGGATFLLLAGSLTSRIKDPVLHLFVTHGLFSKGRELLERAGYVLHTTDSLPRNPDGIPV